MTIAERTVAVTWEKALVSGQGTLNGGTSGALDGLPLTWASRTESPEGKTSPEELAAAAHSGCFAMALALRLGEHRIVPTRLDVAATVTLAAVGGIPTVVSSNLRVRAWAAGLDVSGLQSIVDEAAALCPISRLFTGATIAVSAELEPS